MPVYLQLLQVFHASSLKPIPNTGRGGEGEQLTSWDIDFDRPRRPLASQTYSL